MEPPDALRAFRRSFYGCLHRRGDALFELADAILAADGAAPSAAHLSLQASHRRSWGSLYAALDRGRIDDEALRKLLARHPLASTEGEVPVFAVDTSVWPRNDAEASPQRGYYYHPSRHSAGQPIVAGWAYQFVAQLNFVRESWTAPVDVERVRPTQDANVVGAEQVEALLSRLEGKEVSLPLFVFDAGYDPVKLQLALEGSACQILVRLRAGRRFYGDPGLCDPPAHIGRPRRHGPKMKCNDPSTWPEPSSGTLFRTRMRRRRPRYGARAGLGEDAPEGPEPRRKGHSGTLAHRSRDTHPGRGRAVAPGREAAGAEGSVAVVARAGGNRAGSGSHLALLRQAFRSRTHLPLPKAGYGMDDAESSPPRTGRPVELAGCGRLHTAKVGARLRCGPASAMGTPLR